MSFHDLLQKMDQYDKVLSDSAKSEIALQKIKDSKIKEVKLKEKEELESRAAALKDEMIQLAGEQYPEEGKVLMEQIILEIQNSRSKAKETNLIDDHSLPHELLAIKPDLSNHGFSVSVYEQVLPLAKLAYGLEKNGIPELHAYKLAVLFGDPKSVREYLLAKDKANLNDPQLFHNACLFELPASTQWDIEIWRKFIQKDLASPIVFNILAEADRIEHALKETLEPAIEAKISSMGKQKNNTLNQEAIREQVLQELEKRVRSKIHEIVSDEIKKLKKKNADVKIDRKVITEKVEANFKSDINKAIVAEMSFSANIPAAILNKTWASLSYTRGNENPEAGILFKKYGLNDRDFTTYLKLKQKTQDKIPDVIVDGKDLTPPWPGYYIKKLDPHDPMAAVLGKKTGCCQSIGSQGEDCAKDGITSENSGFFVLCSGDGSHPKASDDIKAQSWAWLDENGALVLDSIESPANFRLAGNNSANMRRLYSYFSKNLVLHHNIPQVNVGIESLGGMIAGYPVTKPELTPVDYEGYSDSVHQFTLYDSKCPLYAEMGIDTNSIKPVEDYFTLSAEEKKYYDSDYFFFTAVTQENIAYVQFVLANKLIPINIAMADGNTALMLAVMIRQNKVANILLKYGADWRIKNKKNQNAFMLAAAIGNTEMVKTLLDHGADLHDKKGLGLKTALYRAARHGRTETVAFLLDQGMDINEPNLSGKTALFTAVYNYELETVNLLLSRGADPNRQDTEGDTPLLIAIREGDIDIAEMLLENKADFSIQNNMGLNALILAAGMNHNELAIKLIKAGANVNAVDNFGSTALIQTDNKDVLMELIKEGADVNAVDKMGRTALKRAALNGYKELVLELIKAGANINSDILNYPSFTSPPSQDHVDVVIALINAGANVNDTDRNGDTILMKTENKDVLIALIKAGANINAVNNNNETALMMAALNGYKDLLVELIKAGANVNAADFYGSTPLIKANDKDVLMELIKAGADVNVSDKFGRTAIMSAALNGRTDMLLELIKAGANLNVSHLNYNVLEMALNQGHVDVAMALIKGGANVDAANYTGETALMRTDNKDVLMALIEAGANVNAVDNYGGTALMSAILNDHEELVLELIKAGANVNAKNYLGETALTMADSDLAKKMLEKVNEMQIKPLETTRRKVIFSSKPDLSEQIITLIKQDKAMELMGLLLLKERPVNQIILNDQGEESTLLMFACKKGSVKMLNALIIIGADINEQDKNGKTALMIAAQTGNNEVALELINHYVDVDATDDLGRTALAYAVESPLAKSKEIVLALIEQGADMYAKNKKGLTPLDIAKKLNPNLEEAMRDKLEEMRSKGVGPRDNTY